MGWCSCTGATDNQGNSFVVSKFMSTKFPLTLLLMELAEQLRSRGLELHLTWLPREMNQPPDDLSSTRNPIRKCPVAAGGSARCAWVVFFNNRLAACYQTSRGIQGGRRWVGSFPRSALTLFLANFNQFFLPYKQYMFNKMSFDARQPV